MTQICQYEAQMMQAKEAKINLRESKEWSKSGQIYNLAHS